MSRALVLISGGIDSATALAWAHHNYPNILTLSFQYHLRPFRERLAVFRLLQVFPGSLIEVPANFLREAADVDQSNSTSVPEGYISNRNMIFYSIACYYAELRSCDTIIGGHIGVDSEAFPDASQQFFREFAQLANQALLSRKIQIELPFAQMTKVEVMKKAVEWRVPFEFTWSCYWDGLHPCGKCISCVERSVAFAEIGIRDPLV